MAPSRFLGWLQRRTVKRRTSGSELVLKHLAGSALYRNGLPVQGKLSCAPLQRCSNCPLGSKRECIFIAADRRGQSPCQHRRGRTDAPASGSIARRTGAGSPSHERTHGTARRHQRGGANLCKSDSTPRDEVHLRCVSSTTWNSFAGRGSVSDHAPGAIYEVYLFAIGVTENAHRNML
jgi:hypothetical protein